MKIEIPDTEKYKALIELKNLVSQKTVELRSMQGHPQGLVPDDRVRDIIREIKSRMEAQRSTIGEEAFFRLAEPGFNLTVDRPHATATLEKALLLSKGYFDLIDAEIKDLERQLVIATSVISTFVATVAAVVSVINLLSSCSQAAQ